MKALALRLGMTIVALVLADRAEAQVGGRVPPQPPAVPSVASLQGAPPLAQARPVFLRFAANGPDVSFHLRTYEGEWIGPDGEVYPHGYTPICTAPCDVALPEGTHHIGLTKDGDVIVEPHEALVVSSPAEIYGTYESRHGTRALGWVILGVGLGVGSILVLDGLLQTKNICPPGDDGDDCVEFSTNDALVGGGLAVGVASVAIGVALAGLRDKASITVTPLTMPEAVRSSQPADAMSGFRRFDARGLAIEGRF
jgi:hypothetical protein